MDKLYYEPFCELPEKCLGELPWKSSQEILEKICLIQWSISVLNSRTYYTRNSCSSCKCFWINSLRNFLRYPCKNSRGLFWRISGAILGRGVTFECVLGGPSKEFLKEASEDSGEIMEKSSTTFFHKHLRNAWKNSLR